MGIVQFQSCDSSSYCTALAKVATLELSPANCENCVDSRIVKHRFCKTTCHTLSISSDITRDSLCRAHWFGLTILLLIMSGPCGTIGWRLFLSVQKSDNCTNLTAGRRQYQLIQFLLVVCNNYCHHKTETALHYS